MPVVQLHSVHLQATRWAACSLQRTGVSHGRFLHSGYVHGSALQGRGCVAATRALPVDVFTVPVADISLSTYALDQYFNDQVQAQLTGVGPATFVVVLLGGVATSLTPCTLSVLPLTIGYIGGYNSGGATTASRSTAPASSSTDSPEQQAAQGSSPSNADVSSGLPESDDVSSSGHGAGRGGVASSGVSSRSQPAATGGSQDGRPHVVGQGVRVGLLGRAAAFSGGLATTFAALGLGASYLGRTYGQIGTGLPVVVGLVAIVMGLNLLEVVPLQFPSLDLDARKLRLPPLLEAYAVGVTFALAASPCSTPVLASLLAFASTTGDPVTGGALLLAYSLGYVAPLLAAAASTGAMTQLLSLRGQASWVPTVSGLLLVSGGTYTLLTRLLPA